MFKRKARKAVGKIANQNINYTPRQGSTVVEVSDYRIAEHTLAEQIKQKTLWSIYDSQKSMSKIHGPIVGGLKTVDNKTIVMIDNCLPPRAWTNGANFRHEFYE